MFSSRQRTLKIVVFPRKNVDFQRILFFSFHLFLRVALQKLVKKMKRIQSVTVLSKKHQNVSPGGPLWLQNGLELSRERTKNSKIVKRCSFFSLHFFSTFFDGVKFRFCAQLCKNGQKLPKMSGTIRPEWTPPALNWT